MRIRTRFLIQLSFHFDGDPDAHPDPYFYLVRIWTRMRIQVTKMVRIRIHNTGSWNGSAVKSIVVSIRAED
jgi:hypothetical protein